MAGILYITIIHLFGEKISYVNISPSCFTKQHYAGMFILTTDQRENIELFPTMFSQIPKAFLDWNFIFCLIWQGVSIFLQKLETHVLR